MLCLTNATLVTPDGVVRGALYCGNGHIDDLGASIRVSDAQDMDGDFLLPGLVEVHTDNIEKHAVPRSGVRWPHTLGAIVAHDAHMVISGVTTVMDAVSAGEFSPIRMRREIFSESLDALDTALEHGLLRADHYLHVRCELADRAVVEMFDRVKDHGRLRLVSLMDHTPGQRQWRDLDKFKAYHADKKWTDDDVRAEVSRLRDIQAEYAAPNREAILSLCRKRDVPLASHDDTTAEQVEESVALGIGISEFPTTREAAGRARELGQAVVMGAPNVVRGLSHSGNVSALELAREGLVDMLSSDYMPGSLLQAAFVLERKIDMPLHEAVAMVSGNPARAVGLDDRGELLPGKRADLLRVRVVDDVPVVISAWRQGRLVL